MFLTVLFSLFFICLAVAHFFITEAKWAKYCSVLCIVLGAAGLIGSAGTEILFLIRSSSLDKNASEWAHGVMSGYFKDVLPVLALILLILILSALFQPKMRIMRIAVILLSSVLCLIYGHITSFLAENGNVSVTKYITSESIFNALMIQFCGFFDFRSLRGKLISEKNPKKKKK